MPATHAAHAAPDPTRAARSRDPAVAQPARGGGPGGLAVHAPGPLPAVVQRQSGGASLPAPLQQGLEQLGGIDLSDVRVHRRSPQPAKLGALAYAMGSQIHLGPGQDHLLPHEAWHVVQQRQGRVPAVAQFAGLPLNDNPALEREADRMGALALQQGHAQGGDRVGAVRSEPGGGAPALQRREAPGGGVLQRAVGFEFETGFKLHQKRPGDADWELLDKAQVVMHCGNNLRLTADRSSSGHSVVEMVLDPPIDDGDREGFAAALGQFSKVARAMARLKADKAVPLDKVSGLAGEGGLKGPKQVQVTSDGSGFTGNPQMTVGVRFYSLLQFLDDTSAATSTGTHAAGKRAAVNTKDQTRNSVQAAKALKHPKGGKSLSVKLQGLLALLANYLRNGRAQSHKLNYAKLISGAYMARTDFSSIFAKLPSREQAYFRRHPDKFAELALDAANLKGQGGALLFDRGVRKSNEPASPDYNVDHVRDASSPIDMTREDWLKGIPGGKDSISAAQQPQKKDTLEGLGALGDRTDRVTDDPAPARGAHDKGQGIVLELRQMAVAQRPEDFVKNAQDIFDYVAEVNWRPGYA